MKKIVSILLVLLLAASTAGCASIGKQIAKSITEKAGEAGQAAQENTNDEPVQDEPAQDEPAQQPGNDQPVLGGVGFASPAESYAKFAELKGAAYERISEKLSASEDMEISMVSMAMLPVVMIDLSLLPLTVLTSDPSGSAAALGMMGMSGVDVKMNGQEYVITYSDGDGNQLTQTSEYDKATDSLKSTLSTSEGESIYFEYTRVGDGYASQTFMKNDDGSFLLIKSYFDETNIAAFGIQSADAKPASIIGNAVGLNKDFVKNDELYTIFENGQLLVVQDGTEKTI